MLDATVILDIVDERSGWSGWSLARLVEAKQRAPLEIDPVLIAEVSVRDTVRSLPLLTRDVGRYRTCFPGLELIGP